MAKLEHTERKRSEGNTRKTIRKLALGAMLLVAPLMGCGSRNATYAAKPAGSQKAAKKAEAKTEATERLKDLYDDCKSNGQTVKEGESIKTESGGEVLIYEKNDSGVIVNTKFNGHEVLWSKVLYGGDPLVLPAEKPAKRGLKTRKDKVVYVCPKEFQSTEEGVVKLAVKNVFTTPVNTFVSVPDIYVRVKVVDKEAQKKQAELVKQREKAEKLKKEYEDALKKLKTLEGAQPSAAPSSKESADAKNAIERQVYAYQTGNIVNAALLTFEHGQPLSVKNAVFVFEYFDFKSEGGARWVFLPGCGRQYADTSLSYSIEGKQKALFVASCPVDTTSLPKSAQNIKVTYIPNEKERMEMDAVLSAYVVLKQTKNE